jgi:hypothetical protein
VATTSAVEAAFHDFLAAIRSNPAGVPWAGLETHPAWDAFRRTVAAHVPPIPRPDLYERDGVSADVFLRTSGLAQAIKRTTLDRDSSHDADLAREFARFVSCPAPPAEEWILLDARLPVGAQVPLGPYILQAPSHQDLLNLYPLPTACALSEDSVPLSPTLFAGAAFLCRPEDGQKPSRGHRNLFAWDTRIELEHWLPLLALHLWSAEATQAEAVYEVQAGRLVDFVDGAPSWTDESYDTPEGVVLAYQHDRDGCTVTNEQLPAFQAFTSSVVDRINRVLAYDAAEQPRRIREKKPGQLARRLRRAGKHLVRGAHRTSGPFQTVSAYEQEEVLLHYVIAMEALLADDEQLDLNRKVQYRAAALFGTGEERQRVAALVKRAYHARSRYVHGDEIKKTEEVDHEELRLIARQVILRFLVLATSRADGVVPVGEVITNLLDNASLSQAVREEQVVAPLKEFFDANPAETRPGDLA